MIGQKTPSADSHSNLSCGFLLVARNKNIKVIKMWLKTHYICVSGVYLLELNHDKSVPARTSWVMKILGMLIVRARTSLHLEISFGRHLVLTFWEVFQAYLFIFAACKVLNTYVLFSDKRVMLTHCLQYQNDYCKKHYLWGYSYVNN